VRARSALAVLAGAALLVSAAPAQAARKKTINIGDNYFTPASVKVKPRTVVTWKWPSFDMAGDVHDVKLKSGPRHVKKFHSQPAASDYSFKRKLTVVGKYTIVCTLHESMKMTIRVRR
jgi:plastocyanin